MKTVSRVFVLGASAGGRKAITKVLQSIPKHCKATFLVVVHGSLEYPSMFPKVLVQKINMPVDEAENGMAIEPGRVIVAKPNHHLFVHDHKVYLSKGPRENLFRPSIDVLFRSAAVAYGNKCVGVLLTGRLNDGTAGLEAIKKCGGLAVIQNPKTAEYAGMPSFAAKMVEIDHVADLKDLDGVILRLVEENLPERKQLPNSVIRENSIATRIGSQIPTQDEIGDQVSISCSTCGGPLWKIKDSKIDRYRCHVGHAFTEKALLQSQNDALEEALWIALRTLEEKKMLYQRIDKNLNLGESKKKTSTHEAKINEVQDQINKLRKILLIDD